MSFINEQKIESPYDSWPGHVILPKELTPEQFDKWWRAYQKYDADVEQEDKGLSSWFIGWELRSHFVLEWHIEGVDPNKHVSADPMTMPSMLLVSWIGRITTTLPWEALDLPKSQAPSSAADNGSAMPEKMSETE